MAVRFTIWHVDFCPHLKHSTSVLNVEAGCRGKKKHKSMCRMTISLLCRLNAQTTVYWNTGELQSITMGHQVDPCKLKPAHVHDGRTRIMKINVHGKNSPYKRMTRATFNEPTWASIHPFSSRDRRPTPHNEYPLLHHHHSVLSEAFQAVGIFESG